MANGRSPRSPGGGDNDAPGSPLFQSPRSTVAECTAPAGSRMFSPRYGGCDLRSHERGWQGRAGTAHGRWRGPLGTAGVSAGQGDDWNQGGSQLDRRTIGHWDSRHGGGVKGREHHARCRPSTRTEKTKRNGRDRYCAHTRETYSTSRESAVA